MVGVVLVEEVVVLWMGVTVLGVILQLVMVTEVTLLGGGGGGGGGCGWR